MNELRIKRRDEDVYSITVNDEGEKIEFDLADIELTFKLYQSQDKIKAVQQKVQGQLTAIHNKYKNGPVDAAGWGPGEQREVFMATRKGFQEMREAADIFLGQGGAQKIFGDRNYWEMWEDFFEAMKPHIERMKLTSDGVNDRIRKKYAPKEAVLE